MSYNRFQWWRSLPRHKKKDERSHPIARIENGDFEYPWDVQKDLEHAQADLRRLEDELENRICMKMNLCVRKSVRMCLCV